METRMPPPSGRYGPPTTPPSTPSPPSGGPVRLLTRFPVVLGGAAGVALAAVALVLVLLIHPAPAPAQPPDAAARAICASLRAQNYTALYAELTPHVRSLGTQDQFIASQRQIDSAQGVVTACAFSVGHVDASSADIAFHITRTRAGTLTGQTGFVFDGSTWQLDTYDTSVL